MSTQRPCVVRLQSCARLDEAEAIIAAIRSASADAIAVEIPSGVSVFTLKGSEHPHPNHGRDHE
jgi:hypothetical protein